MDDTDEALVGQVLAGDPTAPTELAHRLAPRLWALGRRLGLDPQRTEEIVVESLASGLENLASLGHPAAIFAWFRRILIHRWRDDQRARSRRARREVRLTPVTEPLAPSATHPVDLCQATELRERVDAALAELPAMQRAALTLTYEEGLGAKEIAELLDSTPAAIKANLWHARRRIEKRLGDLLGRRSRE